MDNSPPNGLDQRATLHRWLWGPQSFRTTDKLLYIYIPSLQQSWKLTGGLWKTIFLLGNPFVHFHDCWKEGILSMKIRQEFLRKPQSLVFAAYTLYIYIYIYEQRLLFVTWCNGRVFLTRFPTPRSVAAPYLVFQRRARFIWLNFL